MTEIIRQKKWTEGALCAAGFRYYERKKQLVMARQLPKDEAPMTIRLNKWETVEVDTSYMICYEAGQKARKHLSDYNHWPCRVDIFKRTYAAWDEPKWKPNAAESDLMQQGCKPYYKHQGVWARQLSEDTCIESPESASPALIPAGAWVAIDPQGGPYHMDDRTIRERYIIPHR